jgi:hypothetical protein
MVSKSRCGSFSERHWVCSWHSVHGSAWLQLEPHGRSGSLQYSLQLAHGRQPTTVTTSGIDWPSGYAPSRSSCSTDAEQTIVRILNLQLSWRPTELKRTSAAIEGYSYQALTCMLKSNETLSWAYEARVTPNPSIEGTHKRLRLLRSPHVKR